MSSKIMKLNPFLFFLIRDGNIIAWDYKNHQQYELNEPYFMRLLTLSEGILSCGDDIESDLQNGDLISASFNSFRWGWDVISAIFHIGTKIRAVDIPQETMTDPNRFVSDHIALAESSLETAPNLYYERSGTAIRLPPPDFSSLSEKNFLQVLNERKTSRSFDGSSINIETLSTLLHTVFGNFHANQDDYTQYGFQRVGLRKTSPSAGGLHASEAYIVALNIEGLDPGVYHYQAHNHRLTLVHEEDISSQLSSLLAGQYFAEQLSLGIFITSRFDVIWHKYPHSRAYRVALLDVGHVSQTFQLVATALGLNTWLSGVFIDEDVAALLNIQDEAEHPMFFVGAGRGDNSPFDPLARNWRASR
jgi:SagB-type dehydrogenase family enzyme